MSSTRNELVLAKLRTVVRDYFNLKPDEQPRPGERIDAHLKRVGYGTGDDFFMVKWGCEEAFPLRLEWSEWRAFFEGGAKSAKEWEQDIAPNVTYERLADFLAKHLPEISFEPVEVAGHRCGPAGAFYGIREAAEQSLKKAEAFGPSTSILRHLRRLQLGLLWRRLAWEYGDRLPPLRACWSDRIASAVFLWVFAWGATGTAFLCVGERDLTLLFASLSSLLLVPYILLRSFETPLPDGIVTFGDLARRLAEARVDSAVR